MDIKDWILIGGGILLVGVVAHGFWLAWRNRRDTLRIAIDPNIPHDEVDELVLLRAELPNGGARITGPEPAQGRLDLDTSAPVLMEQAPSRPVEPVVGDQPEDFALEPTHSDPSAPAEPLIAERNAPSPERPARNADPAPASRPTPPSASAPASASRSPPTSTSPRTRPVRGEQVDEAGRDPAEIIVINVLSRDGATFPGDKIMEAFLRNGLRFGDMNIFHRIDPATKTTQFSVASAVEPGTFDLSAMAEFSTLGVTMFLRLPGAEQPLEVFDDMLAVARDIASSLGGDLKDEQLSVMTGQTSEHCRQRIAEFSRKRMSQRA